MIIKDKLKQLRLSLDKHMHYKFSSFYIKNLLIPQDIKEKRKNNILDVSLMCAFLLISTYAFIYTVTTTIKSNQGQMDNMGLLGWLIDIAAIIIMVTSNTIVLSKLTTKIHNITPVEQKYLYDIKCYIKECLLEHAQVNFNYEMIIEHVKRIKESPNKYTYGELEEIFTDLKKCINEHQKSISNNNNEILRQQVLKLINSLSSSPVNPSLEQTQNSCQLEMRSPTKISNTTFLTKKLYINK